MKENRAPLEEPASEPPHSRPCSPSGRRGRGAWAGTAAPAEGTGPGVRTGSLSSTDATKALFLNGPQRNELRKNIYFSNGSRRQRLAKSVGRRFSETKKASQLSGNLHPHSL